MAGGHLPPGQREIVAALFIGEAKVAAGAHPLRPVWLDAAAPGAMMSEEVREFVPQGAVHFRVPEFPQAGIQRDQAAARIRHAGGAAHPRIPHDVNRRAEGIAAKSCQQRARVIFEIWVAPFRRGWSRGFGLRFWPQSADELLEEVELLHRAQTGSGCSRAKIAGRRARVSSISAAVVPLPSEKRTVEAACSGGTPIAIRTCEG